MAGMRVRGQGCLRLRSGSGLVRSRGVPAGPQALAGCRRRQGAGDPSGRTGAGMAGEAWLPFRRLGASPAGATLETNAAGEVTGPAASAGDHDVGSTQLSGRKMPGAGLLRGRLRQRWRSCGPALRQDDQPSASRSGQSPPPPGACRTVESALRSRCGAFPLVRVRHSPVALEQFRAIAPQGGAARCAGLRRRRAERPSFRQAGGCVIWLAMVNRFAVDAGAGCFTIAAGAAGAHRADRPRRPAPGRNE